MRRIAVLGAGREQIPIIQACRAEDLAVVGFDKNSKAAGALLCADFHAISNRDVPKMFAVLKRTQGVVGVITAASEVAVEVAQLARELELPGIPIKSARAFRDKYAQKTTLLEAGIPHTKAVLVRDAKQLATLLQERPVVRFVLKPVQGSGSRGVSLVKATAEDRVAWGDRKGDHLLEVYQPGPKISSDTVIWDGQAITPAFADRLYDDAASAPYFKELGISMPSVHRNRIDESTELALSVAATFGVKRGTIKMDLVLTDKGLKIIEATPRLSGWPLPEAVKLSCGVDYFRQAVRVAIGEKPDWTALMPLKSDQVSLNMKGEQIEWEETRRWVEQVSGKAAD